MSGGCRDRTSWSTPPTLFLLLWAVTVATRTRRTIMTHRNTNGSNHVNGTTTTASSVARSPLLAANEPLDDALIRRMDKPIPGHLGVLLAVADRLGKRP